MEQLNILSYPKAVIILGKVSELLKRKDNFKYRERTRSLTSVKSEQEIYDRISNNKQFIGHQIN